MKELFNIETLSALFLLTVGGIIKIIYDRYIGFYINQVKVRELDIQNRIDKLMLPLANSANELQERIGQIESYGSESDWLSSEVITNVSKGNGFIEDLSETGYFYASTVYLFSCFFSYSLMVRKEIWLLGARRRKDMSDLVDALANATDSLRGKDDITSQYVDFRDTNALHKYIQDAIGETVRSPSTEASDLNSYETLSFRNFVFMLRERNKNNIFWLSAISELLVDLSGFTEGSIHEKIMEKKDLRLFRLRQFRIFLLEILFICDPDNIVSRKKYLKVKEDLTKNL